MVFDTTTDVFDTPKTRYFKMKGDFRKMYLNPKAWNHESGSRQIVQAYHDLLYYLEKSEEFRRRSRVIRKIILIDNISLVFSELPLPQNLYENLVDFVVSDKPSWKQSQEEQLGKVKEFFKRWKNANLISYESRYVHEADYIEESTEVDAKKSAVDVRGERIQRQNELLGIRQNVYTKLSQGEKVFSNMKMFKRKVRKFLEKYKADLSYDEEKMWQDKVIITEKAVRSHKKKIKVAKHSRKDEIDAPTVKEMFDEIKEELESLKEFNKKLL